MSSVAESSEMNESKSQISDQKPVVPGLDLPAAEEEEGGDQKGEEGEEGEEGDDEEKEEGEGSENEDGEEKVEGEDAEEEEEEDPDDDRNIMEVDGFRCPKHLALRISPMEFEEMVNLFRTYDANDSGDIDKHEARKILQSMDMEATLEKAEELMAMVDKDGSGEIDFEEFCEFIALVKEGDERFKAFDNIMENIKDTPLGLLEKAASTQGFKLRFQTVEQRDATSTSPPVFVVELSMTGDWWERDENGKSVCFENMTRKFQGLGVTNREARYNAAKAATVKLRQMMPGTQFPEGEFSEEWYEWINDNLGRGVEPIKLMKTLADKGFHPYRNDRLMQRIVTWQSFDIFLARHGDFSIDNTTVIDYRFREWVEVCSSKGIEGKIIADILDEREIHLKEEHPLFYQKLRNNELGKMIDFNGKETKFFTFWTACEDGCEEDILIYLNARQPPNEETLSRTSGEFERPMALAAKNGHTPVLMKLVEFGGDVNLMDRRGRSPLHQAAIGGHIDSARFLVENGARLFDGDFTGNTPLHLAAYYARAPMVGYLSWQGQEYTRTITSDKMRPKKGVTFNELSKIVFEKIMEIKLTHRDLQRVQKDWLHECAVLFRKMCDTKPQSMIGHSSKEIMYDVLNRFDPRKETGVFVTSGAAGNQEFVPSIADPISLASMLRSVFRQAAIDGINNANRTALHLAADANRVDSHQSTIITLIDEYGCNSDLRDNHGYRAIDLLMLDRAFPGVPSSTQVREEYMYEQRDQTLNKISEYYTEQEHKRMEVTRAQIIESCACYTEDQSLDLWDVTREACMLQLKLGRWEFYEDPECLNMMVCQRPQHVGMEGERYTDYNWFHVPDEVRNEWLWNISLKYQRIVRSEKLRNFGRWDQYRDLDTKMDYYYDEKRNQTRFALPKEAQWSIATQNSKVISLLGYGNEWEVVRNAKGDNEFFRHKITGECTWDKPIDAVIPQVFERFCTIITGKRKPVKEMYYVCEQCNRGWKTSVEGAKVNLKICEPCVFRCHDGHKGIRAIKESEFVCLCPNVCKIVGIACCATVISESQQNTQAAAQDERVEMSRKREEDALMPTIFAPVPPFWPNGSRKKISGWRLCRRPAIKGFAAVGAALLAANIPDEDSTVATSVSSVHSETAGSLIKYDPVEPAVTEELMALEMYPWEPPEGLPEGWIECVDPEDPEELRKHWRVLVEMREGAVAKFMYGTVVKPVQPGFYLIKFDFAPIGDNPEEVVHRERIRPITRPTFYCNLDTGESAWTISEAAGLKGEDRIYACAELSMSSPDWKTFTEQASMRRTFGHGDHAQEEMVHEKTSILYYINHASLTREEAAMRIQKMIRRYCRFPLLVMDPQSFSYTLFPNEETIQSMRRRAGWSYLRRRSNNVGEFRDTENDEWEEYVDRATSEYFYWQEDTNRYSWVKPPVPQKAVKVLEYIPLEEEVYFKFPGERGEGIGIIKRLRFDDQTGEDCYDVQHKYKQELYIKMRIKTIPKGHDELVLQRMEMQWRNILRRTRDADERRERREKEEQIKRDLQKLEDLRMGRIMPGEEINVSKEMLIAQSRQKRLEMEHSELQNEIDRKDGEERRAIVRKQIKEAKEASPTPLSRAEVLSLTRTFEMKYVMEKRVAKRNQMAKILAERKQATKDRIIQTEVRLRDSEETMSTPRSLARRTLMRRVHVAMQRVKDEYIICEWGCGDWVQRGHDQVDHQLNRCIKRMLPCALGCTVKMSEEDWLKPCYVKTEEELLEERLRMSVKDHQEKKDDILTVQQNHEENECVKRLVNCPRQCLEWVCFEVLDRHLTELCTKRPAKPIFCRLGCGAKFGGQVDKLIEAEDELHIHESEQCEMRIVRCGWMFEDGRTCAAQMMAKDREEHRDYHLTLMGVNTWTVAGTHLYRVPKGITTLKFQAWGAGGGSGYFKHRRGGNGGGGAFVEVLAHVQPYDMLEIVVGSGGMAGVSGTETTSIDIDAQRAIMKERFKAETFLSREERIARKAGDSNVIESDCGVSPGGLPGGGEGYGGGGYWACGGGGGYTIVSKRTPKGNQAMIVAAGGGGGGSVDGLPGGNMTGALGGSRIDPICGATATCEQPGQFGDSGSSFNSQWPASSGELWQGGHGSEFGAGGGGGYQGGGGGGTTPGIGGGGGGGASYVYDGIAKDITIVPGYGRIPGGLEHDPPEACGYGEWDKVGGIVGEGGEASTTETKNGNAGAVRIIKPGFY